MATKVQQNGVNGKANGSANFSLGESKAILELSVSEDMPAKELSELLSTLNWLHETLSGKPARIDAISIH